MLNKRFSHSNILAYIFGCLSMWSYFAKISVCGDFSVFDDDIDTIVKNMFEMKGSRDVTD